MKRAWVALTLAASLLVTASPASAAEVYRYTSTGSGLAASFTNIDWSKESLEPGEYFETYIDAGTWMSDSADTFADGVCVWSWSFTIDGDGNYGDEQGLFACGEASVLTLDRRLRAGHVEAVLPVIDCTEWDDQTEECLTETYLGDITVDLTLTGTGPTYRYHGTGTGGTAGFYQYSYHGNGQDREATPSGTIAFDGQSLTGGTSGGRLWSSRDGAVEIVVCAQGC